jgi:serine/threonine protein kinase
MPKATRGGAMAALDKYEVGEVLGQGSFAVVKSVKRKSDSERFAMKLIDMELSDTAEVEHERKVLTLLGMHRHIVCLVESFDLPGGTCAFVMELAEGGEVFHKIGRNGPFSEADAADVVRQVALALAFIHTAGIVHRDLKPENLLLTGTGVVKLADFGLAEWCGKGAKPITEVAGTAAYMAPEVVRAGDGTGPPYTETADLFSLGCVLFSLLGAYPAFDPQSIGDWDETMARVEDDDWSFSAYPQRWKAVSKGAKDLICSLLEPNPKKRLTADQVLQGPHRDWVSGEGASPAPLPSSDVHLKRFNNGRTIWRQAASAAAVFAASPLAALHSASSAGGGKGGKGKGKSSGAATSAAKSLPPAVRAELQETFANYDLDGDGAIDVQELRHTFRALGAPPGEAELLMEEFDIDGDGTLSFEEVIKLARYRTPPKPTPISARTPSCVTIHVRFPPARSDSLSPCAR